MINAIRQKQVRRCLWGWWCIVVVVGLVLFLFSVLAQGDNPQGQSTSVIYQVTYTNKSIQNHNDPPKTNKGILMVTRITRTNSSLPSTETISTGNQSMEMLNPGRTQETQLTWNGQAWIPAVKLQPKAKPAPTASPARAPGGQTSTAAPAETLHSPTPRRVSPQAMNAVEVRKKMQEIMELLSVSERAIRQAETQVAMVANTPSAAQNAQKSLAQARQTQQQIMTTLIQLKGQLGIRHPQAPAQAAASTPSTAPPAQPGFWQPKDLNRPIIPPATLNTNIAVSGNVGYGWPGACGWPFLGGNVMIQKQEPNPDFDVGPRVIIREQE